MEMGSSIILYTDQQLSSRGFNTHGRWVFFYRSKAKNTSAAKWGRDSNVCLSPLNIYLVLFKAVKVSMPWYIAQSYTALGSSAR